MFLLQFSNETIFILSAIQFIILLLAFLYTKKPFITVFHYVLILLFFNFVSRPILATFLGGGHTIFTDTFSSLDGYTQGLFYQLIFNTAFIFGYLFYYNDIPQNIEIKNFITKTSIFIALGVGVAGFIIFNYMSGGAAFDALRKTGITLFAPGGQLFFRIIIYSNILGLVGLFIFYNKEKTMSKPLIYLLSCLGSFVLIMMFQRGSFRALIVLICWLMERFKKITLKNLAISFAVALIIMIFMRPFAHMVREYITFHNIGDELVYQKEEGNLLLDTFVYKGNFVVLDAWSIAVDYVQSNGYLYGKTFLSIPFAILPLHMRFDYNHLLSQDELNYFYYSDVLIATAFGFNTNIAQEIFINFGPLFLILGFIPGIITAKMDKWLYSISKINILSLSIALAIVSSFGFAFEFGWCAANCFSIILIGFALVYFEKWLNIFKRKTIQEKQLKLQTP